MKTQLQNENSAPGKIGMVSLGCPKALVDSERILTSLRSQGYELSASYEGADAVIVNTCGFLDSAKAESLAAIGEALSENGKVIVTGCLGVEEGRIRSEHPGVLAITGPHQYEQVVKAVQDAVPQVSSPLLNLVPEQGIKLTPRHYAYLKISEGCNHHCSFCIIPGMRGRLKSRPSAHILYEAERLANAGVQEILIISQDTSAYGTDLKYETSSWHGREIPARLPDLCRAMSELGIWIRLHYVYPYPNVDNLIPLMNDGLILPYLDIPFQHGSPKILKAMKRPAHQEKTLDRIANWRRSCPTLAIRSTFIVGFPGETDADFEQLLGWLDEAQLDRVGCFTYEDVAGASANELADHVPEDIKQERQARFMAHQQAISAKKLQQRVGEITQVIIDEADDEGAVGRTYAEAPEIDGVVRFPGIAGFVPGDMVEAEITAADEHDLFAEPPM